MKTKKKQFPCYKRKRT